MALIVAGGLVAYQQMGRLEDPEFTIKEALIITPYPGRARGSRPRGDQPDRDRLSSSSASSSESSRNRRAAARW